MIRTKAEMHAEANISLIEDFKKKESDLAKSEGKFKAIYDQMLLQNTDLSKEKTFPALKIQTIKNVLASVSPYKS
jgi:hypothetical protein